MTTASERGRGPGPGPASQGVRTAGLPGTSTRPAPVGARPAAAAEHAGTGTEPPSRRRRRRNTALLLFLLPALFIYGLFLGLPLLAALAYSFTDWGGGLASIPDFVGADNYRRLAADPIFRQTIGNNVQFTLIVLIAQTGLSLGLALLLVRNSPVTTFYRALYFMPTILASVSVAIAWILMYDPNVGAVNVLLQGAGLEGLTRSWLGDRAIAIRSLAVIQFWQHTGQVMIIFIAGLQAIPRDLLEAASVDGASTRQRFRHITLPLLAPATTIVVAYTTIQSFRAFDLVIALTDGGPSNSTEILATWIYHSAFRNYQFGYASAGAVLFLLIVGGLTLLQFRLLRVET